MSFHVVIPARYASVRLPGKPLLALAGKPMLQWVYERACAAGAHDVTIATDDERIATAARAFGARVVMTAADHASGTDRIAEVARRAGWQSQEIVVNLQGDEPLMPAALISQVAHLLASSDAEIATLARPLASSEQLHDPHVVKVVSGRSQRALYFSRAPIPWVRDAGESPTGEPSAWTHAQRHIGLYAYRVAALLRLASLPPSPLEQLEKLEQLRALENDMVIRVAVAVVPPGQDVNTATDLAAVAAALEGG